MCRRQRSGGTEGSNPASSRGESANHRFGTAPPIVLGRRKWDRELESGFLQRRFSELSVPEEGYRSAGDFAEAACPERAGCGPMTGSAGLIAAASDADTSASHLVL